LYRGRAGVIKPLKKESFAIVVFAAGKSSRLGQMKQLISINGKSLLERQLSQALAVTNEVYCVLGFQSQKLITCVEHLPVQAIINHTWQQGLSSSIATAVASMPAHINAIMLLLVDQYQLTVADLLTCKQRYLACNQRESSRIFVANNSNGTCGPPVIFPQQYFNELLSLTGQQGAKPLLVKHQQSLEKIALMSAFFDIDTPHDLTVMQNYFTKS
jgi:molybdenum cofactor cytidylyltransferase